MSINKAKIKKVLQFIQDKYVHPGSYFQNDIQIFFTPSLANDYRETVYDKDGVVILFAPGYYYVEVYGLSEEEENWITANALTGFENFDGVGWKERLEKADDGKNVSQVIVDDWMGE